MFDFQRDDFYEVEIHYVPNSEFEVNFKIDTGLDYADINQKLALSQGKLFSENRVGLKQYCRYNNLTSGTKSINL